MKKTLHQKIALAIEIFLNIKNWTKVYLAKQLKISTTYLQCLLKGRRTFTTQRITDISRLFGVKEWELIKIGTIEDNDENDEKQ